MTALPVYEPWVTDPHLKTEQNTVYGYVAVINHLGRLIEACKTTPQGHEDFQPHIVTYLKLLLVCTYARNCFLPIGSGATKKVVYLDVLSASGLSTTKESPKDPIAGSCFLTPLAKQDFKSRTTAPSLAFAEVHTFDFSQPNLSLLQARRDALVSQAGMHLPPYHYHAGDANTAVPNLVGAELSKNQSIPKAKARPLYLAFIDNQALDIHMSTIQALQGHDGFRCDLIVHLPTSSIWRAIQAARATPSVPQPTLDAFFGSEIWKTIASIDDVPDVYQKVVLSLTHDPGAGFQEFAPVRIKGPKTEFALCFYVRQTGGTKDPKGWLDSIRKVADACNNLDEKRFQAIFNRSVKGQKSVLDF